MINRSNFSIFQRLVVIEFVIISRYNKTLKKYYDKQEKHYDKQI